VVEVAGEAEAEEVGVIEVGEVAEDVAVEEAKTITEKYMKMIFL